MSRYFAGFFGVATAFGLPAGAGDATGAGETAAAGVGDAAGAAGVIATAGVAAGAGAASTWRYRMIFQRSCSLSESPIDNMPVPSMPFVTTQNATPSGTLTLLFTMSGFGGGTISAAAGPSPTRPACGRGPVIHARAMRLER